MLVGFAVADCCCQCHLFARCAQVRELAGKPGRLDSWRPIKIDKLFQFPVFITTSLYIFSTGNIDNLFGESNDLAFQMNGCMRHAQIDLPPVALKIRLIALTN